ncbi:MAG TPA: alkyl hydroperoxide reductase, partial [Microbacteriaceae bacterium]|nr:alkyl hydroperoxide reductase [Microbacteriaceae bacterium]
MKGPIVVTVALVTLLLASCSNGGDGLAEQYREGTGANYISGDGALTILATDSRTAPVLFSGELDTGGSFSSEDHLGEVVVVNFWYAGCPPCRLEAPDLEELHQQFLAQDVTFVGVNILDQAP